MQIHVFNPEHDYALAAFSPYYTPPAAVKKLSRSMALFPAVYARPGDAILVREAGSGGILREAGSGEMLPEVGSGEMLPETHYNAIAEYLALVRDKGLTLLYPDTVSGFVTTHAGCSISPWGWNPSVKQELLQMGIPEECLPSTQELKAIRGLSSREFTIKCNALLNHGLSLKNLDNCISPLPRLFRDAEAAQVWSKQFGAVFFKAPWSSSGRGILCTEDLEERHILPWLRGIIRRQGLVLGETAFNKWLDFATEWEILPSAEFPKSDSLPSYEIHESEHYPADIVKSYVVKYCGVSVFEASRRGKYHCNVRGSQTELYRIVKEKAPDFSEALIDAQKYVIERLIAPCYHGPLGIDMMADAAGHIRACVEINLRRTMGHAFLEK